MTEQDKSVFTDISDDRVHIPILRAEILSLTQQRDSLQCERDAWKAALTTYGHHDWKCARLVGRADGLVPTTPRASDPCTCGYDAALALAEGPQ